MFFCPNCNNSLSITQNLGGNAQNLSETPDTLSTSEDLQQNNDNNNNNNVNLSDKAVFKCSNCGYMKEIEPGTLILSRAGQKSSVEFLSDRFKYSEMVHDLTLPHTRNFICPNKICKSHNDSSIREAVFFKPNKSSYNIVSVGKVCQAVW